MGSAEGRSGFGFELTMRLKREADETGPPTWPAVLLQALARYVFQSGQCYLVTSHDSLISFKKSSFCLSCSEKISLIIVMNGSLSDFRHLVINTNFD